MGRKTVEREGGGGSSEFTPPLRLEKVKYLFSQRALDGRAGTQVLTLHPNSFPRSEPQQVEPGSSGNQMTPSTQNTALTTKGRKRWFILEPNLSDYGPEID